MLAGFASRLNLEEAQALKLAASFGGGIARRGQVCGAVSGALMALGLGRADPSPAAKEANYERAEAFLQRFEARHPSLLCRELTGCDMTTPEGRQQAKALDIHHTVCTALIRDAAELAGEMLEAA